MAEWLQSQWYRQSVWQLLLRPLSWLFLLLSSIRRLAYRARLLQRERLAVPVIVVGNISVGGTGKTPLVVWLAQQLTLQGHRPAIISRGYAASHHHPQPVFADSEVALVGDEPVLLARRSGCPVWVGRDRVAAGRALLAAHPECDVILSDDGLQHYRLQRDFEIAVVDAQRGFGNSQLLPAGPLRELPSRLRSVDAVVSNGPSAMIPALSMQLLSQDFQPLHKDAAIVQAAFFLDKQVCAVAGIGNPTRFFRQLHALGLHFRELAFPDHHAFQPNDFIGIQADAVVMTEKDAVKCAAFSQPNWWYLPVTAEVDNVLLERILSKLFHTSMRAR